MRDVLRGSSIQKWSKLSIFCFLLKKCLQVVGHYVLNFKVASGTRTPPPKKKKKKKKIRGKMSPEGVQICLFSLFIFIIYSFIHLIYNYFPILVACDECMIFLSWIVLLMRHAKGISFGNTAFIKNHKIASPE